MRRVNAACRRSLNREGERPGPATKNAAIERDFILRIVEQDAIRSDERRGVRVRLAKLIARAGSPTRITSVADDYSDCTRLARSQAVGMLCQRIFADCQGVSLKLAAPRAVVLMYSNGSPVADQTSVLVLPLPGAM